MTAETPEPAGLDAAELRRILVEVQCGVVSRRQITGDVGGRDHDIARMVRRHELRAVHPGVYVDHTGPLSWDQRAWAAVLAYWPAALTHDSALLPPLGQRGGRPIQVAIDLRRSVGRRPGVRVHRTAHLGTRVDWNRTPPRVRLPEAVLDVVLSSRDPLARSRVLADACQSRRTTPAHLVAALAGRRRVAGRELLVQMLADLEEGAASVLEREYLRLERLHGLPAAQRQQREHLPSGSAYRDVPYQGYAVVVELDGRTFHDSAAARDRDFERDLDTRVADEVTTVRLTYGQGFDRGCATIGKVALLLTRRGWPGPFFVCPSCPVPGHA